MATFIPAAWKLDNNNSYLFWQIGDNQYTVSHWNQNLMEDPIDKLYRWVDSDDYDKDFNEQAVFNSLEAALKVAKETLC